LETRNSLCLQVRGHCPITDDLAVWLNNGWRHSNTALLCNVRSVVSCIVTGGNQFSDPITGSSIINLSLVWRREKVKYRHLETSLFTVWHSVFQSNTRRKMKEDRFND
jgi:hypothetical protein